LNIFFMFGIFRRMWEASTPMNPGTLPARQRCVIAAIVLFSAAAVVHGPAHEYITWYHHGRSWGIASLWVDMVDMSIAAVANLAAMAMITSITGLRCAVRAT
jgi:hypothetical protein